MTHENQQERENVAIAALQRIAFDEEEDRETMVDIALEALHAIGFLTMRENS